MEHDVIIHIKHTMGLLQQVKHIQISYLSSLSRTLAFLEVVEVCNSSLSFFTLYASLKKVWFITKANHM